MKPKSNVASELVCLWVIFEPESKKIIGTQFSKSILNTSVAERFISLGKIQIDELDNLILQIEYMSQDY